MEVGGAGLDAVRAAAMAEHYQNTMDLVIHHYERRSRQFVTLVAVVAGAALVAFARPIIAPSIEAVVRKYVPLEGKALARLQDLTPFAGDLLLAFLVITIFYLTANLVNRSTVIVNYYTYLERVEPEIRRALGISERQLMFSREGTFYAETGADTSKLIAACYRGILGTLLAFFFAARLFFDYPTDVLSLPSLDRGEILTFVAKVFLFVVDVLVVVPTMILFLKFVRLGTISGAQVRERLDAKQNA
jgi:flagellar biosynthesis protein FlhB